MTRPRGRKPTILIKFKTSEITLVFYLRSSDVFPGKKKVRACGRGIFWTTAFGQYMAIGARCSRREGRGRGGKKVLCCERGNYRTGVQDLQF